jgi:hypothetical protein
VPWIPGRMHYANSAGDHGGRSHFRRRRKPVRSGGHWRIRGKPIYTTSDAGSGARNVGFDGDRSGRARTHALPSYAERLADRVTAIAALGISKLITAQRRPSGRLFFAECERRHSDALQSRYTRQYIKARRLAARSRDGSSPSLKRYKPAGRGSAALTFDHLWRVSIMLQADSAQKSHRRFAASSAPQMDLVPSNDALEGARVVDPLEGARLVRAFLRINDPKARSAILQMVENMVSEPANR